MQLEFDHVIFACHSNQALSILGDQANAIERRVLSAIPFEDNVAVLHTDIRQLPKQRRAWACWNYYLPISDQSRNAGSQKASATYNMNMLQGINSRHTFCVTLNPITEIDPSKILGRFSYEHPIFTTERAEAQASHDALITHTVSFCGAYWGNGFHEDGVNSALKVCQAISRFKPEFDSPWVDSRDPATSSHETMD